MQKLEMSGNQARNANDHEQQARVHPAQPSHFVVVPTMERGLQHRRQE
jgi:hypothetical protein